MEGGNSLISIQNIALIILFILTIIKLFCIMICLFSEEKFELKRSEVK